MEERQRQGRTSQRAGQENSQRKERTEGNWKAIRAHWDGGEQFNLESHAEPLPGSFPERQGKEHSKELCTLRMPRAGQTTHTEIHIYIYVNMYQGDSWQGKRSKKDIARAWRGKTEH